MHSTKSQEITETLSEHGVHDQWSSDYRTQDNELFFDLAFDRIVKLLELSPESSILDAGCGSARHSARLAQRGLHVTAVDFSDSILERAAQYLATTGTERNVTLRQEDLLSMSFEDNAFEFAICWGVLMHVYEVESAVAEIARVVQPGGRFVISEGNMHSFQARGFELLRKLLKKGDAVTTNTEIGMEYWTETSSGKLLTREASIGGLTKIIERQGFQLEHRIPGQFTEAYTRVSSSSLRKLIHGLNRFWFNYVPWPGAAFGNILIFRRLP